MRELLNRSFGLAVDQLLCGSLALLHRRHAQRVSTREAAEEYFATCDRQTRAQHFALPATLEDFRRERRDTISWRSPAQSVARFPMNGRVTVRLFPVRREAPTVILLHSRMSASDAGYRVWARRFNALDWNAAFVHL